jgi:hypothetical protein
MASSIGTMRYKTASWWHCLYFFYVIWWIAYQQEISVGPWYVCLLCLQKMQKFQCLSNNSSHFLNTLQEHMSSPTVFSRVHVAKSLVFYVVFSRSFFWLWETKVNNFPW